jgi:hypothetical protein
MDLADSSRNIPFTTPDMAVRHDRPEPWPIRGIPQKSSFSSLSLFSASELDTGLNTDLQSLEIHLLQIGSRLCSGMTVTPTGRSELFDSEMIDALPLYLVTAFSQAHNFSRDPIEGKCLTLLGESLE